MEVSVGPVTIEPISAGQHVVMVEADGYFQHTEVVEVNETGVQRVSIELTSESGEKASAPVVVAESTRSGSAMVDRPTVSEPVGRRFDGQDGWRLSKPIHFIAHGLTGVRQRSSGGQGTHIGG